jgi:predicted nucleic acid-binding protein
MPALNRDVREAKLFRNNRSQAVRIPAEFAAHAYSIGVTLVTANVSEFERVRGLRVENWLV